MIQWRSSNDKQQSINTIRRSRSKSAMPSLPSFLLSLSLLSTLSTVLGASVDPMQNYTLPPPFADLEPSSTIGSSVLPYTSLSTFSLSCLCILIILCLTGWFAMGWFAKQLVPKYGHRLKYNVVTGRPTLREAPVRTLPTPEEVRRKQQQQQENGNGSPNPEDFSNQQQESRFHMCCPVGCDDRFWCPPCLLHCSCLSWLWCGPRWCCGQATFGEWLFHFVYRNPAFRWIAFTFQILILTMNILALGLDRWSIDRTFEVPVGTWDLRVGLIKMRTGEHWSAKYGCGKSEGKDLLQCGTMRIGAGFVLAFALVSTIFVVIGIIYSMYLLGRNRSGSPRLWFLAVINSFTLIIILLLWPLTSHLILDHTYTPSNSLELGPSWGIFWISLFLETLRMGYLKGHVESTGLNESGDVDEIEEEEKKKKSEMMKRSLPGITNAKNGDVLILHPEQLELEARRAEAARWTIEGYGGDDATSSTYGPQSTEHHRDAYIRSAYASGLLPSSHQRVTHQPMWHANETIPSVKVLEPTFEQIEREAYEYKLRQLQQQQQHQRHMVKSSRFSPEQQRMEGPYVTEVPRYLDASELDRLRSENPPGGDDDFLITDTGLGQRDALRHAYGLLSVTKPTLPDDLGGGRYTLYANETKPIRLIHNTLNATFARTNEMDTEFEQGYHGSSEAQSNHRDRNDNRRNLSPRAMTEEPYITIERNGNEDGHADGDDDIEYEYEYEDVDADDEEPQPQPPSGEAPSSSLPNNDPSQFKVLSPRYVRDSLQLDMEELHMFTSSSDPQTTKKKERKLRRVPKRRYNNTNNVNAIVTVDEVGLNDRSEHQPHQHQPPHPSASSQPWLTPSQHRQRVEAEHATAPNLLRTPMAASATMMAGREYTPTHELPYHLGGGTGHGPVRLPPLPSTLSPSPHHLIPPPRFVGGTNVVGANTPSSRLPLVSNRMIHHPFATESPTRPNPPPISSVEPLPLPSSRLYHYTDPSIASYRPSATYQYGQPPLQHAQPSHRSSAYHHPHHPPPSVSRDLHFTGTLGATGGSQIGSQRGDGGMVRPYDFNLPPPTTTATFVSPKSGISSPRFALNMDEGGRVGPFLSVDIDDPYNRTIGTPKPIVFQPANREDDIRHDDDDDDDDDDHPAPARRQPMLSPQTPKIIDGPQSASILRQTPRQAAATAQMYQQQNRTIGPYSNHGYY